MARAMGMKRNKAGAKVFSSCNLLFSLCNLPVLCYVGVLYIPFILLNSLISVA